MEKKGLNSKEVTKLLFLLDNSNREQLEKFEKNICERLDKLPWD